ncbi:Ig-like domain-containing protein [Neobacillus sp. LXY-1]|uniref:Ig-like domain-containing protein n=1 Tax=Neobacillus sp. LXY-1 TaxID=3379133 RepID=UPI003EE1F87B
MGKRGLLHKIKLYVSIILVLCIQLFGPQQILPDSSVKGAGLTGTDPKITITSPVTGDFLNETNITVTGTIENVTTTESITLFDSGEEINAPYNVSGNSWSIPITSLTEGTHIFTAIAVADGNSLVSDAIKITIDVTPPTITVSAPIEGKLTNSKTLEGKTEADSTVEICMDCSEDSEGQVTGSWLSVLADNEGNWSSIYSQLTEGTHTVYVKAIDQAGNQGSMKKVAFTLDTLRPIVLPDVSPKQDMTQVPLTSTIKVKVSDTSSLDEQLISNSISVIRNGSPVEGTIQYNQTTKEIMFTPKDPLSPSTRYKVMINPAGLVDLAGNGTFPKFWSFTTVSIPSETHKNPHGGYENNVNICANCHSSHNAQNPNLLSAKLKDESQQEQVVDMDNYCMACHDGTGAPIAENTQSTNIHKAAVTKDGKPNGSACASCHNPHLDWSANNPNLLQDEITYTHLPKSDPNQNKPTGEISSKDQLCESCHESNSGELIANPAVEYRVFNYKKSNTALGIYEDYQLCLRCHNHDFQLKYDKAADIANYYNNLTEEIQKQYDEKNGTSSFAKREISVEEKNFSEHIIKAQDGSPLAGHIPCAECHDTHGSSNIYNLKTQMGHDNPTAFDEKTGTWDAEKERKFCVSCHNGSTAIYGITGTAIYDQTTGIEMNPAIPDHNKTSTKACSKCHSDSTDEQKAFMESAHAPKKGKLP